jgi:hypothetical protein
MLGTAQYKLSRGSHAPDDPNEDVCLLEAAIIAAGFERREIKRATECPPCFSRVLAQYAFRLNDSMPDDLRNELLLPFVTRLAGTANSAQVESARAAFIAMRTVNTIIAYMLQGMPGYFPTVHRCRSLKDIREMRFLLLPSQFPGHRGDPANKAIHCIMTAALQVHLQPLFSVNNSGHAAMCASEVRVPGFPYRRIIWTMAAKILDAAIRLEKLRPAEDMSAWPASITNMKPSALAVGLPGEVSQPHRELEFA